MIELIAPAKLTWYLEITARRADGYHLLRSEMVSLDLADTLTLTDGEMVVYHGGEPGLNELATGQRDLVTRALFLAGRRAQVEVSKVIPSGGGLGGGSSDAAAILRWAEFESLTDAVTLGGDVPFCIHGGRALVSGVGESVEPLPFEAREVTLFIPPFGVNTAKCYAAFDELVIDGWRPNERNHLREAACRVEPRMNDVLGWVGANVAEPVLAGSGSTVFVEGRYDEMPDWVSTPVGDLRVVVASTTPAL